MSFSSLGVLSQLENSLTSVGIAEPTPVQRLAIPALLGGVSAILVARTGSGKTVAYGAPLLQRLRSAEDAEGLVTTRARPRAVVLTSTRELVDQAVRDLKAVAHGVRQRVRGVSGGMLDRDVAERLREPVDLLVANPPRLRRLVDAGRVDLSDVRALVVDEADTLLSPGQRGDVEALLAQVAGRQVVYVSATLPEPIRHWCLGRPERPVLLQARDAHAAPDRVRIRSVKVKEHERADAAHDLLVELGVEARGIVFTNTREGADAAAAALVERGHDVRVLHGARLPRERAATLKAFRAGQGRALVTTELAGRGLHLEGLAFVLNYELPPRPSDYLHRVGRVGRMGASGEVVNLWSERDAALIVEVERLARGGKLDTGESLRAARDRSTEGGGARGGPKARPKPGGKGGGAPKAGGGGKGRPGRPTAEGPTRRGPKGATAAPGGPVPSTSPAARGKRRPVAGGARGSAGGAAKGKGRGRR